MSEASRPDETARPARSLRAQIIGALIGGAGVRLAGVAVTFLVGIQLARHLGPAEYGVYGTVIAVTSIAAVIAQFGLPQLLTRELAYLETSHMAAYAKGALVYFALMVACASAFVVAILWLLIGVWPALFGHVHGAALAWGLALAPLTAFVNLGAGGLRGLHRAVSAQVQDALVRPTVFGLLLMGLIFVLNKPVNADLAITLQAIACASALFVCGASLALYMPKSLKKAAVRTDFGTWASSSLSMAGTEILRIVDGQYAVLLLGAMMAISDVGHYRVAQSIAAFIALPSTLVNLVLMSHIAHLHRAKRFAVLQRLVSSIAIMTFLVTTLATLAIILAGKPLIASVFGAQFISSWEPLWIIGIAYCIDGLFGCAAMLLNMCGQERLLMRCFVIGLCIGAVASWLLVPVIGISGAACGMAIGQVARVTLMWIVARSKLGIDTTPFGLLKRGPLS
ncbi:MAG: lipopolysaccharide biosynthesis protein [Rhodoblastus sp.]